MLTLEQKLELLESFIKDNCYRDEVYLPRDDYAKGNFVVKCSFIEGTALLHSEGLTQDEKDYIQGLVD